MRVGLLSFAVMALAVGCNSGSGSSGKVGISGDVRVTCRSGAALAGGDKVSVSDGQSVSISDAAGKLVGSASLGSEQPASAQDAAMDVPILCKRPWSAEVPASEFYSVSIAGLTWPGVPLAQLRRHPVALYGFYTTDGGPSFRFDK